MTVFSSFQDDLINTSSARTVMFSAPEGTVMGVSTTGIFSASPWSVIDSISPKRIL